VYVCICVSVCVSVCICVHEVCVYMCVCICVSVYMCVCVCVLVLNSGLCACKVLQAAPLLQPSLGIFSGWSLDRIPTPTQLCQPDSEAKMSSLDSRKGQI